MATQWVKKPKTTSQSWIILVREEGKSVSYQSPELDSLNRAWKEGQLTEVVAEEKCREILKQVRRKREKVSIFNSVNAKVLDEYWDAEYSHRILIDPQSMKNSLIAAINDVGHLSLLVATRGELQTRINQLHADNPDKHRRRCSRLNQLLKYLKRGFKLQLAKTSEPEISYISEEQFKLLLTHIPLWMHSLVGTLFYSGMRLGEAFEFQIKCHGVISVRTQLDNKGKSRGVKNRRPRNVAIESEGWKYIEQFLEQRSKLKEDGTNIFPRNYDYRSVVKGAAKKLFKDVKHHITVHDLRHSFAIHMLNRGLSLTEIALLLGDSVAVANRYYLGFVATDETLALIQKKLAPPKEAAKDEELKNSPPKQK